MSSVGPVDVFVDFAGLGRVQTELQNLLALVEGLDRLCAIDVDGAQMGSDTAAGAVTDFTRRWQIGRHAISEDLARCQAYAEMALEDYGRTEHALGTAIAQAGATIARTINGAAGGGGGGGAW